MDADEAMPSFPRTASVARLGRGKTPFAAVRTEGRYPLVEVGFAIVERSAVQFDPRVTSDQAVTTAYAQDEAWINPLAGKNPVQDQTPFEAIRAHQ